MYDEKLVEESIRICKEAHTFYNSSFFLNPKNVFDLDTYLPVAKEEEVCPTVIPSKDPDFQRKLEEAIAYGMKLRKEMGMPVREVVETDTVAGKLFREQGADKEQTRVQKVASVDGLQDRLEQILDERGREKEAKSDFKPITGLDDKSTDVETIEKAEAGQGEKLSRKEKKAKRKAEKERLRIEKTENEAEKENEDEEDEEEVSFAKIIGFRLIEIGVCVGVAYVMSWGFNHYIGTHTIVEGTSMETTLHDKDVLAINKVGYLFHDPKRFDIVVFPFDEDTYYIKRIIGLPGERLKIVDGMIYINDQVLEESYGMEALDETEKYFDEVTIGEDQYFVMGDNRNHSMDSRSTSVGLISKDKIEGKAFFRLYPFETMGDIR